MKVLQVESKGRMFTKKEIEELKKIHGSILSLNVYHDDDGTLVEVATVKDA